MPLNLDNLPTWAEFLFVAEKQGILIGERNLDIAGPRGDAPAVRFLQRPGGAKVIVPPLRPRDVVRANLLGSLCRTLGLDPAPLGLSLEDLPPEGWP